MAGTETKAHRTLSRLALRWVHSLVLEKKPVRIEVIESARLALLQRIAMGGREVVVQGERRQPIL